MADRLPRFGRTVCLIRSENGLPSMVIMTAASRSSLQPHHTAVMPSSQDPIVHLVINERARPVAAPVSQTGYPSAVHWRRWSSARRDERVRGEAHAGVQRRHRVMTAGSLSEFHWMRIVLTELFESHQLDAAVRCLQDATARGELRAALNAHLEARAMGAIPPGDRGDNLVQALLVLRVKFPPDEAAAKLELNIAMRERRA